MTLLYNILPHVFVCACMCIQPWYAPTPVQLQSFLKTPCSLLNLWQGFRGRASPINCRAERLISILGIDAAAQNLLLRAAFFPVLSRSFSNIHFNFERSD